MAHLAQEFSVHFVVAGVMGVNKICLLIFYQFLLIIIFQLVRYFTKIENLLSDYTLVLACLFSCLVPV